MRFGNHVTDDELIGYLDGELKEGETATVQAHCAGCAACRKRKNEFARLSYRVQALVSRLPVETQAGSRARLAAAVERHEAKKGPGVMKRFAWGMALASAFAIGIILAPRPVRRLAPETTTAVRAPIPLASYEVNGESFIALPYSNPDLPMSAPRIVEMQIPVSSLATAGIFLQPAVNGAIDRTVLANVLLGMDGQPLGVHVLSAD